MMPSKTFLSATLLGLFAAGPFVSAAETARAAPALTTAATPARSSRALTAKIAEALPKYTPRPVETPAASPQPPEADRPQNDILRLPRYEVGETKPPVFRERELLTRQGRIAVALKRHPGLKFGPFSRLNIRRGLEMLAEERQAERNQEMAQLTGFIAFAKTLPRSTDAE